MIMSTAYMMEKIEEIVQKDKKLKKPYKKMSSSKLANYKLLLL